MLSSDWCAIKHKRRYGSSAIIILAHSAAPAAIMDILHHSGSTLRSITDQDTEGLVKESAPRGSPIKAPRKLHVRVTRKDDRKLLAVVRKNPTISIREAMALSNYPAGEQTARKRIKESNVNYLGPKKAKLPLEVGSPNWVLALNNELQKVVDLFND
jgi:hypothetical protein